MSQNKVDEERRGRINLALIAARNARYTTIGLHMANPYNLPLSSISADAADDSIK